jgi:hypothetical protein
MKQLTLLIACMLASILVFSQTKRIAHRSHSGKDHTFTLFGPDNFGLPAEKEKLPKPKTDKKTKPVKDSLKTVPPAKTDTILKTIQPVTKADVYMALLAAQKRFRRIGLL